MRRMIWMPTLLVAGALVGCGTPYKEPEAGPRARIRLIGDQRPAVVVRSYPAEECRDGAMIATLGNFFHFGVGHGKSLGMPNPPKLTEYAVSEQYLEAGRTATLHFRTRSGLATQGGATTCNVTISFDPAAGSDYEAEFKQAAEGCSANVFRLSETGARSQEPSVRMSRYQCQSQ